MANTSPSFTQSVDSARKSGGYTTQAGRGVLDILQFPLDIGVNSNTDEPQQPHYMVIYINEIKAGAYNSTNDMGAVNTKDVPVFLESGSMSVNRLLSNTVHGSENKNSKDGPQEPPAPKQVSTATFQLPSSAETTAYNKAKENAGMPSNQKIIGNYESKYPQLTGGAGSFNVKTQSYAKTAAEINGPKEKGFLDAAFDIAPEIKRTVITVVLPMPDQIQTSYDPQWSEDQSTIIGNIVGAADEIRNATSKGVSDSMMKWVKSAGVAFAGDAFQNITQRVTNPRSQMLFQNMSFRDFSWTWTLYPKNAKEAKALWDIIEFMKYHILPEYDNSAGSGIGVFLIQPSLFDIEFHSHGQRNDWLPKTLTCICKNISVDYAPAGTVAFFEPYIDPITGRQVSAPIGVRLSMSFMENEILTKNRVRGDTPNHVAGKYDFNQGAESHNGTL